MFEKRNLHGESTRIKSFLKHSLALVLTLLSLSVSANEKEQQGCAFGLEYSCVGWFSISHYSLDKSNAKIAVDLLFKTFTSNIGLENGVRVSIFSDSGLLQAKLRDKQIDTIISDPVLFLDVVQYLDTQHLYTTNQSGQDLISYHLITQKSQNISHISQLKGKRLAIATSNVAGKMFLEIELAKAGYYGLESFFSAVNETEQGIDSINDLLFNKADLALGSDIEFQSAVDLNHQVKQNTSILSRSQSYVPYIIGFHKALPESYIAKIDESISSLFMDKKSTKLLSMVRVSSVTKIAEEDFQQLGQLKQEYQHCVVERSPDCVQTQSYTSHTN